MISSTTHSPVNEGGVGAGPTLINSNFHLSFVPLTLYLFLLKVTLGYQIQNRAMRNEGYDWPFPASWFHPAEEGAPQKKSQIRFFGVTLRQDDFGSQDDLTVSSWHAPVSS